MKPLEELSRKESDDQQSSTSKYRLPFIKLTDMRRNSSQTQEIRLLTPVLKINRYNSLFQENEGIRRDSSINIVNNNGNYNNKQEAARSNSADSSDNQLRLTKMISSGKVVGAGVLLKSIKQAENFSDDFMKRKNNILKRLQLKVKMMQVTKFLPSRMYKNLNSDHLKWIGDISSLFSSKENQRDTSKNVQNISVQNKYSLIQIGEQQNHQQQNKTGILDLFLNLMKSIPIFHPTNKFRQLWYIAQLVLISIIITMLPIQLVFSLDIKDILTKAGTNIIFIMMIGDIFIQMNTGYYNRGTAILDRTTIIRYYLKKHLFDGIIADLSLIIHTWFFKDTYTWVLLFYFFKLKALKGIEKRIFEFIQISPMNMNFILLLKLTMSILYVSHFFACIWVQVAYWEQTWMADLNSISKTWMDNVGIIKEGKWYSQYIAAYYFSSVTMITVGYGDIKAENEVEMILCTLNMITACGVFAFSVNQIGFIFDQFGKQEKQIQGNMYVINRYMNEHKISSRVQYQIKQYLEYYWTQTQENYEKQEKEIIAQLTENLRFQLKQEANRLVVRDTNIFSNNFSQNFISRLVPLIKESTLIPDQYVIHQHNDEDDASIFFIKKGSLKVIFETQKNTNRINSLPHSQNIINVGQSGHLNTVNYANQQLDVKVLGEGEYFGQIRFFTGQPRNASVKTLDFTKLLSIKREDFMNVIKQFPQDYEVLAQINHVYNMEGVLQNCGIKCFSCGCLSHTIVNCPYIQLTYDKFNLMRRNKLIEDSQQRESCFVRETGFKHNALKLIQINMASKFDFLDSMTIDDNFDDIDDFGGEKSKDEISNFSLPKKIQSERGIITNRLIPIDDDNSQTNIVSKNNICNMALQNNITQQLPLSPTKKQASSYIGIGNNAHKGQTEIIKMSSLQGFDELKLASTIGVIKEQTIQSCNGMQINDEYQQAERILNKIEVCIDHKFKNLFGLFTYAMNQPQQINDTQIFNQSHTQDLKDINDIQALNQNMYNSNNMNFNDAKYQKIVQQFMNEQSKQKGNNIQQQNKNKNTNQVSINQISQQINSSYQYQSTSGNNNQYSSVSGSTNQKDSSQAFIKQRTKKRMQTTKTQARVNQVQLIENQTNNKDGAVDYNFQKGREEDLDNGFENFRIFKKFLVHNNIDAILHKFNNKQSAFLEQYQHIIDLKLLAKKNKRRELKLQKKGNNGNLSNSNLNLSRILQTQGAPYPVYEKSQYGGKSIHQDIIVPRKMSLLGDKQFNTLTQFDAFTNRVADDQTNRAVDDQTQYQFNDSQRTFHLPKQITAQIFQNNHINSICDVLHSARKNKHSTSSQVYEFDQSERMHIDQTSRINKINQSILIDSTYEIE